jgi:subtilisin family serine protease
MAMKSVMMRGGFGSAAAVRLASTAWLVSVCGIAAAAIDRGGAPGLAPATAPCEGWRAERNALLEADPKLAFDPGSILVMFEPAADEDAVLKALGGEVLARWKSVPGLVHVSTSLPVDQAVDVALKIGRGQVRYAEPDYVLRADATANDARYREQWGLRNSGQPINGDPGVAGMDIRVESAWDVTTGSSAVIVASIDTGVRGTHQDLAANMWRNTAEIAGNGVDDDRNGLVDDVSGWNFFGGNNNAGDDNGHGTHTAGTFGARGNNGAGVAGVAWNSRIMPLKFLGASGGGFTSGAIGCLDYAVRMGAKISNNSWRGGGFSQSLLDSIRAARNAGHLFVAAAGNSAGDNDAAPVYPASYDVDNIISVAAVDNDGRLAGFSCYGRSSVDLAAPGVQVLSCWAAGDQSFVFLSGTSMATPHVAGVASLVWSANPSMTMAQVRSRILGSTRSLPALAGKVATGGMLDAAAAVRPSTTVALRRGVSDNFSRSDGTEAAVPRSAFAAATRSYFNLPLINFDVYPGAGSGSNVIFADSFASVPAGIRSATLTLRLRAGGGGSETDVVRLGFAASSASSQIGSFTTVGIGSALGRTWSAGQAATLTINLGAVRTASGSTVNLIPQLNSRGFLDVIVSDDSGVDFMQLDLVRDQ